MMFPTATQPYVLGRRPHTKREAVDTEGACLLTIQHASLRVLRGQPCLMFNGAVFGGWEKDRVKVWVGGIVFSITFGEPKPLFSWSCAAGVPRSGF